MILFIKKNLFVLLVVLSFLRLFGAEEGFKNIKVNNEFKDRDVEVKVNNRHTVKQGEMWGLPENEKLNNIDIVIKENKKSKDLMNAITSVLDFDFNKNEDIKINFISDKSLLSRILIVGKIEEAVQKGVKNRNVEIVPEVEGNNLVIQVKKKEVTLKDREEIVKKMVNEFEKS